VKRAIATFAIVLASALPGQAQQNIAATNPGLAVGCLTVRACADVLFTQIQRRISVQSPVDPGRGIPCFLDPQCLGSLRFENGKDPLGRKVTMEDVARNGANFGDYIPTDAMRPTDGSQAVRPPANRVEAAYQCTSETLATEVGGVWLRAAREPAERNAALHALVDSYVRAAKVCAQLR
jgi:hypothetical protein